MGQFMGRVLLLCPTHSGLGEMITATVRKAGPDLVALCPQCLEAGKEAMKELSPEEKLKLREKVGLQVNGPQVKPSPAADPTKPGFTKLGGNLDVIA